MQEELIDDNSNVIKKYKIGLVLYILYILCETGIDMIDEYNHDYYDHPFTSSYIYVSLMVLFFPSYLIVEFIRKKCCDKKAHVLTRNFYYFLNKKRLEENAFNDLKRFSLFSENHFKNNIFKISLLLMSLSFIGTVARTYSISLVKLKSQNSTIVLVALVTTILLQKCYFDKNLTIFSILGIATNLLGLLLLFLFQFLDYFDEEVFFQSMTASIISGLSFSFLISLLKLYYQQYGYTFNIFLVYGYIGLFCLTIVPFILFIIIVFFDSESELYFPSNMLIEIPRIILGCIIKNLLAYYTIVYLSPAVFIIGVTFTIPSSVIFDYLNSKSISINNPLFILGSIFIIVSFLSIAYSKYKKIKSDEYVFLD
jgi:hypothetical protein